MLRTGRIGQPDPRLKTLVIGVPDARPPVTSRTVSEVSKCARQPARVGIRQRGIHGGDISILLGSRNLQVPAEPKIQCQIGSDFPVILKVESRLPPAIILWR